MTDTDSERTACPFCGLEVSDEQFDEHVSNCMMVLPPHPLEQLEEVGADRPGGGVQ